MALPVSSQLRYWGISRHVVFGLVLMAAGGHAACRSSWAARLRICLDPIADRLERWGLSRLLSTTGVITLAAMLAFVLAMLLIVPLLRGTGDCAVQHGASAIAADLVGLF